MESIKCKICEQEVNVKTGWYGTGRIFHFNCKCKTLEPFNGQGSFIDALDYAKRKVPQWVDNES